MSGKSTELLNLGDLGVSLIFRRIDERGRLFDSVEECISFYKDEWIAYIKAN
jgi:hypothetical protein